MTRFLLVALVIIAAFVAVAGATGSWTPPPHWVVDPATHEIHACYGSDGRLFVIAYWDDCPNGAYELNWHK